MTSAESSFEQTNSLAQTMGRDAVEGMAFGMATLRGSGLSLFIPGIGGSDNTATRSPPSTNPTQ